MADSTGERQIHKKHTVEKTVRHEQNPEKKEKKKLYRVKELEMNGMVLSWCF